MKENYGKSWRERLANIIFEVNTPTARLFDAGLLVAILISVVLVVIETIKPVQQQWGDKLYMAEWVITIFFTIEYVLRLTLARHAAHYARSFYGVVDLLAILPTYLELFFLHPHYLMVVRVLRFIRLFRILKLTRYIKAGENIRQALYASRDKIIVFLGSIAAITLIIGACMYLIEGPENGFRNIPVSMYWAINTMTPVSESELTAKTVFGQTFAALLMILGYAILAVPTGIVSSEISKVTIQQQQQRSCPNCASTDHDEKAEYCKYCAAKLPER